MTEDEFGHLTKEDYKRIILAVRPIADHHMRLLEAHYRAPDHTVTMTELAAVMKYQNYNAVNLHYGNLAAQMCEVVRHKTDLHLRILVTFYKPELDRAEHWRLTLREPVVAALAGLKWFQ